MIDNVNIGVKKSQDLLDRFNDLTVKCSDPSLTPDQIEKVMNDMNDLQNQIDVSVAYIVYHMYLYIHI